MDELQKFEALIERANEEEENRLEHIRAMFYCECHRPRAIPGRCEDEAERLFAEFLARRGETKCKEENS